MKNSTEGIRVVYFQRKPFPIHKSIENIFQDLRLMLPSFIKSKTLVFRNYSKGLINRLKIIWEAYQNQGDVNHITGDIHFSALLLSKRKTMLTIHDCRMLSDTRGLKHLVFKTFWFTLPLKNCALVTVVSAATKEQLLKFVNYPPEQVRVIPNAIAAGYKYFEKPFNSLRPVILQVGTTINKNIERLVEAVSGINCTLNIIGTLSPTQVQLLREHNIEYINSSDLTEQELIQQYIDCDIVSFVSTYEGFGLPIVEANAVGRPVITSNILSMPEVAGDAACIVNPMSVADIKEGLKKIINDASYRNKLVENGLENRKRFDAEKIVNSYVECYRKLVAG